MKPLTEVRLHKVKVGKPSRLIYRAVWFGLRNGIRRRRTETIGPVRATRYRDAKLRCAEIQDDMNSGRISLHRLDKIGLANFLEHDLGGAALDLKRSSLRELKTAGAHAMAALGTDFNVQKVAAAEVAAIRHYLQGKGFAASTVLKNLSYLQGAFRRGVDLGIIHANPFAKMKRPKFQTARAKVFSQVETEAMLFVCGDIWWEAFIRLGVTSGCRRGEMIHLRWDSIDWEASTVTVNPQKGGAFKVDGREYPLLAWESKDYETRVLPLPEVALDTLRRLKAKAGASPYVFVSLKRLAHIAACNDPDLTVMPNLWRTFAMIQKEAKALLEQTGDRVEWPTRSIKTLRSTYATQMSRHVSSFELRGLMGHSSVLTTEKHYVATTSDLGQKVRDAFDGKASKAATA